MPSPDPQNQAQVLERERRVVEMLVQGMGVVEIAQKEGVSHQAISRVKNRALRRIVVDIQKHSDRLKAGQIAEIRRVRREAWKGWEASTKPKARQKKKTLTVSTQTPGGGAAQAEIPQSTENTIEGQAGNPQFLDRIYKGIELEAKLAGTEAPIKIAETDTDGRPVVIDHSLAERHRRFDELIAIAHRRMLTGTLPAGAGLTAAAAAAAEGAEHGSGDAGSGTATV